MGSFDGSYITSVLTAIKGWVGTLIPLLMALALVALFYGLVKYIWGGADDKDNGKRIMIWGVIALAVMTSVWGLVGLLQDATGIQDSDTVTVPTVPGIEAQP